MIETKPLTFPRERVLETLKERLAESERKRQEEIDAQNARMGEARERLIGLINDHPQFLIWLSNEIERGFGERPTSKSLEEIVANAYPDDGKATETHDPDREIKRLIRVLELSEDPTLEIAPTDDLYKHL